MNPSPWRYDPLSGLRNMLAFFEYLSEQANKSLQQPITILYFDLVHFAELNHRHGRDVGDRALRWLALALQDELPARACFRLRGDEFAAVLQECRLEQACDLAAQVQERFVRLTGGNEGYSSRAKPLHIAALHLSADQNIEVVDVVIALESLMQQLKKEDLSFIMADYPVPSDVDLRTTVSTLIDRVLELGAMLDQAICQAETDPLTGLPNSRAMQRQLQEAIALAQERHERLAVLLVDGDNLRAFNKISYAAGDLMIQQLATILSEGLREQDRLARWRLGDEFLILLPNAGAHEALQVAQRLVRFVQEAEWKLPVTISAGIALFPEHGEDDRALVDAVETALNTAKEEGKNRAALFNAEYSRIS